MRTIGAAAPAAPPRRGPGPVQRLLRALRRHRRLLSAVLLAAAAGTAVSSLQPAPPPTAQVLAAARDLPAGHRLGGTDVRAVALPPGAVPDGALSVGDPAADGAVLAAPVRRGEALTDARLAGPGLLRGAEGHVLALPVAVDGPLPTGLVAAGDRVSVLAGPAPDLAGAVSGRDGEVLVRGARVLLVPGDDAGAAGLVGPVAGAPGGAVVVLALDPPQAARVAGAAGVRPLHLALQQEPLP